MKLLALFLVIALPWRITTHMSLPPNGEYQRPVVIDADHVTLDCKGSSLVGDGFGVGILIQHHQDVTVRNCRARGFDVGMYVVSGNHFVFEGNDFSGNYVDDNYAIEDLKPIPHGGLVLNGIQDSLIQENVSNGNIAGIQILNSSGIRVLRNTTSQNRGWGIYLYGTTASSVYTNTAEYDNRSCWSGRNSGCGAAGIALTQHSDRNSISWNILNNDGDGIYQGNTPASISDDNEISYNKISNSVANGIEATFSSYNYVHHNSFDDDNYGGWFGYAQYLRFEYNTVRGSRTKSIQADNAQFTRYVGNRFEGADVLLQPWLGGTCKGNIFSGNTVLNSQIVTTGCQ